MKTRRSLQTCLIGALLAAGSYLSQAQDGQVAARPLSRENIADYGLPQDTQVSGGLNNVGLGQPLYLEVQIDAGINPTNILGVVWSLTNSPAGSTNTLAPSPLDASVPIYNPGDRAVFQVPPVDGRRLLVPTASGEYAVKAVVTTTTATNTFTRKFQSGTYMGWDTCQLCHSGGYIPNKILPWSKTGHASTFAEAIDGISTDHFQERCIACHSVGYDKAPLAVNDGFDDRQVAMGWTFPTNHVPGNWDDMVNNYEDLAYTANVQCENCHGAGSPHAYDLGNPDKITVSFSSGDCAQCHEATPYHIKNTEWNNSRHAIATRYPTGENRSSCVRCHSGVGFVDYVDGNTPPRTMYEAITCAACHDPHPEVDNSTVPPSVNINPHMIRTLQDVTLNYTSAPGGPTVITQGGKGKLCMNCHQGRRDVLTHIKPRAGSSHFGPHYGCQTDMLAGKNAWTYGKDIPSSAHLSSIGDSCVTCHLQATDRNSPEHGLAGGHTFKPAWDGGTPEDPSDDVHLVGACVSCHGQITSFDIPRKDYNNDGVIEGVQTEVKHMLDELGMLLPPVGSPDVAINSSWSEQQLRAGFNWEFVKEDGSYGVHNIAYAVGLLQASIEDMKGNPKAEDANSDGLPDDWQIAWFGSIYNPAAAPNADPAGDGVPNWLKQALGLDPTQAGIVVPDGVVYASGKAIGGAPGTLYIYTAAEVTFDTEIGKTYQIQEVSALSGGWQDLGSPIPGTGNAISYVTPTRDGVQQFFRVLITP